MDTNTEKRCIEAVRSYAAICALPKSDIQHGRYNEVKCKRPKSVEFFQIDEHDDLWGTSDKCLYRIADGQCTRYPFDHETFMAFHILTRDKQPTEIE